MVGTVDVLSVPQYCSHCGMHHAPPCPRVAAIEYYENGLIKRVEYVQPRDGDAVVSGLKKVWDSIQAKREVGR